MKTHQDTIVAVSAAPPAGISGMTLLGVSLPDWVLIATALYTALATFVLIRDKFYIPWKEKQWQRKNKNSAKSTD